MNQLYSEKKIELILDTTSAVNEICQPLNAFGINYFSYNKIYKDGSCIDLNSNGYASECYYKNGYYERSALEGDPFTLDEEFILWSTIEDDEAIQLYREHFNISNGITLIDKQNEYCELWHFAATTSNYKIINFYLNNFDILKTFLYYFKDKCKKIIEQFEPKKIKSIGGLPEKSETLISNNYTSQELIESLNKLQQNTSKFYLKNNSYLTRREFECLYWCIQGKSAVETGQIINISARTVQEHLNNIKIKLDCYKQTQLVTKAIQLGLYTDRFIL